MHAENAFRCPSRGKASTICPFLFRCGAAAILRSDQMQPLNAKPVQIRRCRATVIVKALLRVSQVASPAKPLPLARAEGGGRRCEPLHCKEMSTARLA